MHVALVMAGIEDGGMEKHVLELALGLAEAGLRVTVVAHRRYAWQLQEDRVGFCAVDLGKSRRHPLALWSLRRALWQLRPDLIHVHGNKAAAMVGSLKRWLPRVPLLATFHSSRGQVRMFRPFAAVIAVSQRAAQVLFEQLPDQQVYVIHNGIQQPIRQGGLVRQPGLLLAVGRLVPIKNFAALIEAVRDLPVRLWIAGEGPERAALTAQIAQHRQQDQVQLLGHRDDVPALLQQASWHVISSHDEGGPYTLAEALLLECPVLSTPVGMVPDYVAASWLSANSSAMALHALIDAALEQDAVQVQRAFAESFRRARVELTFEAMRDQVLALYGQLLQASPS